MVKGDFLPFGRIGRGAEVGKGSQQEERGKKAGFRQIVNLLAASVTISKDWSRTDASPVPSLRQLQ